MRKTRNYIKRKRQETDSVSSLADKPVLKKVKNSTEAKNTTKHVRKLKKTEKNVKVENDIKRDDASSSDISDAESVDVKKQTKTEIRTSHCSSHRDRMYVGAHVSISGGIENAPENARTVGARTFALFLRNQRTWICKPMKEDSARKFRKACEVGGYSPSMIVPHGSYLLNCGAPNPETLRKSREALVDEVQRCEILGLTKYNFHPGSTCGEISTDVCLERIAQSIDAAHQATKYCTLLLENMSCQGNTVGGTFEELRGIIDRVKDKTRIGVCLDTCHAMAAGYDLSKKTGYDRMMEDFDQIIGLEYLQAVHLNDSKGEVGCHLDRHENIGRGKIGLSGFTRIMEDKRLENIPMVLETPLEIDDKTEIELLYSLC